jgi:hypothetical protein
MAAARDMLKLPAAPPAALLFSNRTISALAAAVQDLSAQSHSALPPCTPRAWPDDTRPLSSNQQQMWILRGVAGAAAYNLPLIQALEGHVDSQMLQQALNMVAARHEVLRMHYQEVEHGVVGVVAAAEVVCIRLRCITADDPAVAGHALHEAVNTPFDLSAGPPVRALLLTTSSNEHIICIVMHHIAGDGWSSGVLWKELSSVYATLVSEEALQLPPLPVQYSDYAAWQQEVLASDQADQWRSYWREALLGAPALLQLPCDRPRPAEPTYSGGRLIMELCTDVQAELQSVTSRLGVNMQAALLGVFQARPH